MNNQKRYPSNEYELLHSLQDIVKNCSNAKYSVSIGDDAAVRQCSDGEQLIITTDIAVENIDFKLDWMNFREIGYRAMVSNLSDCAAMGAVPDSALIQLTFPGEKDGIRDNIMDIYRGFADACHRWNFAIVGGDLSSGPSWSIGITLVGRLDRFERAVMRQGACDGDFLWVSGVPGLSAAGLAILNKWGRAADTAAFPMLLQAHISPRPRIELGVQLRKNSHVSAMMDLSDGLSKDCRTLAYENGLGIILQQEPSLIPPEMVTLSNNFGIPWENWYFHGGEEYELLFAASADFKPSVADGTDGCICIGKFTKEVQDVVVQKNGILVELARNSYDHVNGW
ncbi:MAG TPA: thiamine-phosphate kinase [Chitinispirillaceae bacterium]|nr:thiamine-phosphate kinase [Chitinispirillaceae bacterium]